VNEFALEMMLGLVAGLLLSRLRDAHEHAASWLLIVLSAFVVGVWDGAGLLVTLALTGFTWAVVRLAQRPGLSHRARATLLAGGVAVLVATLIAARWPAEATGVTGLSFTVFRLIGVAMDGVNLGLVVPLERVLLLALFFPTFRAGPIATLQSLREADAAARRGWAVRRIVLGIARKLLLADTLAALLVQPWLAREPSALRPEHALVLPVLLSLWIYWDFAGYSDVAIGVAALLGYQVPENFDRPYLARNLLEFWRRWHMTLSEWIRTRLFMKLAGRRAGAARTFAAILAAMALCGAWHGVGLHFLVWGLWHGAGMVAVHATRAWPRRPRLPLPAEAAALLSALGTFLYVSASWLVFFLPLDRALAVAARAAGAFAAPLGLALLAGCALAYTAAYAVSRTGWNAAALWRATPVPLRGLAYALVALGAMVQMADPAAFIYFRF
jgi:alginate O-acetyltransferase complex protein AlgI